MRDIVDRILDEAFASLRGGAGADPYCHDFRGGALGSCHSCGHDVRSLRRIVETAIGGVGSPAPDALGEIRAAKRFSARLIARAEAEPAVGDLTLQALRSFSALADEAERLHEILSVLAAAVRLPHDGPCCPCADVAREALAAFRGAADADGRDPGPPAEP